jgi:hypothetical protein
MRIVGLAMPNSIYSQVGPIEIRCEHLEKRILENRSKVLHGYPGLIFTMVTRHFGNTLILKQRIATNRREQ